MLIDNKVDRYRDDGIDIRTVWDFIKLFAGNESQNKGKIDIVTGYFTIRALARLFDEIPAEDIFRIISTKMIVPDAGGVSRALDLLNGGLEIESTFFLREQALKAKQFLEREQVDIKGIFSVFCHAKMYQFTNKEGLRDSFTISGSSNLTDAGLGLKESSNIELNIASAVKTSDPQFKEMHQWFEDVWKKAKDKMKADPDDPQSETITVKQYFINLLEHYFRDYTPNDIYYKVLYEYFKNAIDQDNSLEHERDLNLLQETTVWNTLYPYQQKGVISLIKMLRNYGGAILADAVGLGKTFEALAVMKYFQIQGFTILILCPKRLESNWIQYKKKNDSRFESDELDYEVRFHTDLQNDRLENSYNEAKLSWLRKRDKLLIVIDESHNLRNEKSNRYKYLLENLIQKDPEHGKQDLKVLMLSATPINTGLKDIKSQIKLTCRGTDDGFKEAPFSIKSLDNLFSKAQKEFTDWSKQPNRTVGKLITKLDSRFFTLTDHLIVARTRRFIEDYTGENLGFPKRNKPINIYQGVESFGSFTDANDIHEAFLKLTLAAYQPSLFIPESRKEARKQAEKVWDDNVSRERFLVLMMSSLFMKRLESSWHSCMITIDKVLKVHENTLQKVVAFRESISKNPNNDETIDIETGTITGSDEDVNPDDFELRKGLKLSEMKNIAGFERALKIDINRLTELSKGLHDFAKKFSENKISDPKINKLTEILKNKAKEKNKKVLIFTAYEDTAKFLFTELQKRGFSKMAYLSGSSRMSTGTHTTTNFQQILESFAPFSKLYKEKNWNDLYERHLDKEKYYDPIKKKWNVSYNTWKKLIEQYDPKTKAKLDDPIDILIATDCVSEGQNLQDADLQINYDIHWNPVRLIQRFGRIDRLGSPNNEVQCVNFWPTASLDEYINLQDRVQNRMAAMEIVGTETQKLSPKYEEMVNDNFRSKENDERMLKEMEQNSISDIETPDNLTMEDLTLEIYRQDLLEYLGEKRKELEAIPCGAYSGFRAENDNENKPVQSDYLIALLGEKTSQPQDPKEPYKQLILLMQPIDGPTQAHTINDPDVLKFLRNNRSKPRVVPQWIDSTPIDTEKLSSLSRIIEQWMDPKAQEVDNADLNSLFDAQKTKMNQPANEVFKKENFDLVVWEYVSKYKSLNDNNDQ